MTLPEELRPLHTPRDEESPDVCGRERKHRQSGCERCVELGHNCWDIPGMTHGDKDEGRGV